MLTREGDLIRTKSNVVFDVKGLLHPIGKVIAFPRFIPSPQGTRKGNGVTYGKVYSLDERFKYLQQKHPDLIIFDPVFGETLCEVPTEQIAQIYRPTQKLAQLRKAKQLSKLEAKALRLATTLKKKAAIPWSAIGISGSIMAGLTTETSDIDPLVYGVENSRKAYAALQELRQQPDSGFKAYSQSELKNLYDFRFKDTKMSFVDFKLVESRKAFQGMFEGTDYFIRFVKDGAELGENYGDVCYKNSGYLKITAKIADSNDALFTPCNYTIKNVQVIEGPQLSPICAVVSFRGRFCMQVPTNQQEPTTVEVQGKAEQVTDKRTGETQYRIIIGNKPTDYMVIRKT